MGRIAFGDNLVNRDLKERFDVSSTPVRDAIHRLYADGLIESIEQTGAKVISFTLPFALDVNEILMYIVKSGMESSFRKGNQRGMVKDLQEIMKHQIECIGSDAYFDYDYKFHKTFVEYSGNSRLIKLFNEYNVLHEVLVRSFIDPKNGVERELKSIKKHNEIIEAIEAEDLQKAVQLNEEHYKLAEILFKENL